MNYFALLAGIVANPQDTLRWLVLADWLDEHGQPERAELMRLHRELLRTCCEPEAYPERLAMHDRLMELLWNGVKPSLPRQTMTLPGGVKLPTVFIPPGSFRLAILGPDDDDFEDVQLRAVTLTKGFFLGASPVTQAQWVAVMGTNPSGHRGKTIPVGNVTWDDAVAFCEKASRLTGQLVRLPTQAEWEYAAKAGTSTAFYWGNELNGTQANCDGLAPCVTSITGPSLERMTPVGSYADISPHPWGLMDMVGNVWEWCADWHHEDYSSISPDKDPTGPGSGTERAIRGGSALDIAAMCVIGYRFGCAPNNASSMLGFRIAISLD